MFVRPGVRNVCRIATALLIIGGALSAAPAACAENWADRLGFPPDAKVVVLHANALGMCYESNAAGTALLELGPVRSAAVMVPAPWFGDAAQWSKAHPDADVGLELTLNSEFEHYRWKPVAPSGLVASLEDSTGFLWRLPMQTMVNATAEDVERELRAQIARAKEAGLQPTHFTTHLGTLVTRPDFIEVYLRLARQEWIPAMIVELTPEQVAQFEQAGFPLPDDIIELLANYPLPKVDDLRFVGPAASYDEKKQEFLEMLGNLRPGITQIAFHPAAESDALKQITPDWQQRVWDAQLMGDPHVRAALLDGSIIVTDWRDLMRRFEGHRPGTGDKP